MKKGTTLVAVLLCLSGMVSAQTWSLDKGHSKSAFIVQHHMISDVDGYFKTFDAKLTSAKDDFSDAVFEFSTQTASINTENEMRDGHLKGEDFFNSEKFPAITFKSTSFKKVSGNKYTLAGDLTIKGVTKPISMDVTLNGPQMNERTKKPAIGIKAISTINRKDFGVGQNLAAAMVSEEVELRVTGEFNKD